MTDLIMVDGLWWPAVRGAKDFFNADELSKAEGSPELAAANKLRSRHGRYARHERDSDHAIKHCKQRRTCIQAGGHVGIWPMRLASKFELVVTFEPEPANFDCLVLNTKASPFKDRIRVYNLGLDERVGEGRLAFNGRNIGGHKCRPDGYTREGDTIVPVGMTTIDTMGLPDVGFICLDIEGYEARALRGAERTVERCRPVIMVESWAHGEKIGDPEAKLWAWFRQRGYREAGHVSHDYIWVPK